MENWQNVDVSPMAGSLKKRVDQIGQARSHNDVMTKRLKNRERQRRYRARKRLEADNKGAYDVSQPTLMQVIDTPSNPVSRVHCQRNWKRDARRAHMCKDHEAKSRDPVIQDPISANASHSLTLTSGVKTDRPLISGFHLTGYSVVDNNETHRVTASRRHWKAEARNKKN